MNKWFMENRTKRITFKITTRMEEWLTKQKKRFLDEQRRNNESLQWLKKQREECLKEQMEQCLKEQMGLKETREQCLKRLQGSERELLLNYLIKTEQQLKDREQSIKRFDQWAEHSEDIIRELNPILMQAEQFLNYKEQRLKDKERLTRMNMMNVKWPDKSTADPKLDRFQRVFKVEPSVMEIVLRGLKKRTYEIAWKSYRNVRRKPNVTDQYRSEL